MPLEDIRKQDKTRPKVRLVDQKQQEQRKISSESPACMTEGWLLQTSPHNWTNVMKKMCQHERRWGDNWYASSATERKECGESISFVEGGQPSFFVENIPFSSSTIFSSSIRPKLVSCHASPRHLFSIPPSNKYCTKPFLRWVRLQGCSPHASGIAKNTVDIPLIRGGLRHQAINPPKRIKAWGTASWGWRKSPVLRYTWPDPCRSDHSWPKCDPKTEEVKQKTLSAFILRPTTEQVWHKAFFKVDPVDILLIRGTSSAKQLPPLEEGKSLVGQLPEAGVNLQCQGTPSQIHAEATTAGQSATQQLKRWSEKCFLPPMHSGRTYIIMPKGHIWVNRTMW